jgi:hypothetical protein
MLQSQVFIRWLYSVVYHIHLLSRNKKLYDFKLIMRIWISRSNSAVDLFVLGAATFLRKWNNRTEAVLQRTLQLALMSKYNKTYISL